MTPEQIEAHMALVENYLRADTMQHRAAVEASARQLAEQGAPSKMWVLIATDAYEAGFGKGVQAKQRGVGIENPWGDEPGREGWALGYEMGKQRAASPTAPSTEASEPVGERDALAEAYAQGRGDQFEDDSTVIRLLLENCDDADQYGDGQMNTTRIRELLTHFEAAHTTPPPAPVLSDAEIDAIFNEHHNPQETPWDNWRRFARAILGRASRGAK